MASGYVKGRSKHLKDEDFQEEEIWGLMEGSSSVHKQRFNPKVISSSSSSSSTPRMMIPRKEMNNPRKEHSKRLSTPVSIPNILHGNDPSWVCYGNGDDHEDDNDDEIVPPHEYIARRLARTQISSFSVSEGVGRKLKGRDLSEVRNNVLRKTGFLER